MLQIVAVPYGTSFDHLRVADEVHFIFERCLKSLGPQAIMLARFGVGHSLGALLHALIGSRYPIVSSGNVLMSFNNRPATGAVGAVWVRREGAACLRCSGGGGSGWEGCSIHQMAPLSPDSRLQARMPASTLSAACSSPVPHLSAPHAPTLQTPSPCCPPSSPPTCAPWAPSSPSWPPRPCAAGWSSGSSCSRVGGLAGLGWLASNRGG
jgi:hypothetical protein